MVNSVVLIGRLTRDPEMRTTQNGTPVVSYTLAVNRRFKTQGQPEADFINCVAWNKTADTMARYLHKGSLIAIQGRIQTRNYENQQGQRVYVTEVVTDSFDFLESRNAQPGAVPAEPAQGHNSYNGNNTGYGSNSYNSSSNSSYRSGNYQPKPQAPNPYAQPAGDDLASGYASDETMDISTDDLPF